MWEEKINFNPEVILSRNIESAVKKVRKNPNKYNCFGFIGEIFDKDKETMKRFADFHINQPVEPVVGSLHLIYDEHRDTSHVGVVVAFDELKEPLILSKQGYGGDLTIKTKNDLLNHNSELYKNDLIDCFINPPKS